VQERVRAHPIHAEIVVGQSQRLEKLSTDVVAVLVDAKSQLGQTF
jgi:hypothetical protein